jgi:hypothetical protein
MKCYKNMQGRGDKKEPKGCVGKRSKYRKSRERVNHFGRESKEN